ncbi:MAG: flavin reductase family protein [Promethearchaeota archaeon]
MKFERKPLPLLVCPVVLVTTQDKKYDRANIITLTLVGGFCWEPPIIGVGIGRSQYSKGLIDQIGEFVVNVPTTELIEDVEYCGLVSGKDIDKFANTNFTPVPSKHVKPPMIKECPINLECKVIMSIPLGSNVLFLGKVVCLHVDESILDSKGGMNLMKANPIMFNLTNSYWSVGEKIASYGFSKSQKNLID